MTRIDVPNLSSRRRSSGRGIRVLVMLIVALVAGISPQMWLFSVRDKTVAAQLDKAVGHRVQLHYTEHPGVPTSCFADTRYFVDRVIVTDIEPASQFPQPPSGPSQALPDVRPGATL